MTLLAATDQVAAPAAIHSTAAGGNNIRFEHVSVAYRGTVVLDDFTLTVEKGEILALLGPSGSGKTTALRVLAGFTRPVSGRVWIGSEDVTDAPPYARGIGLVVQNYALFPHMTVVENVAFGLRAHGEARSLIAERVGECLRMVGMEKFGGRYPRQLSGGQQQRVAIARALAIRPRVLLLDEPLSALDAQIRRAMVEEIARLHRELKNLTILYVTHDQAEALTLADRIGILRDGKLNAVGSARQLYHRPPNRFVAEFLGRANTIPVHVEGVDPRNRIAEVRFGNSLLTVGESDGAKAKGPAILCVRPHDLKFGAGPQDRNAIAGTVRAVHWQGETLLISLDANGTDIRLISTPLRDPPLEGSPLTIHFAPEDATLVAEQSSS